ncbi:hypothetical protein E7T09_04625 [Deinococcus sp. KSM4-11]|uniref:hypothetical protein n=1 Tax=Deinococcus sp. KSM4-11 TaxID=2568654 RepID=UPI0010A4CF79|nr:hypothetical protein [Deinococcus sp. KSM4-11]THF88496.1 hypothetical protein E7T09_04625 [Deinococcus sp. KSM4-11]
MMKLALGLVAATALLASCGSSGGNSEAQGRIVDVTTEYTTSTNPTTQYAGCDNISNASAGRSGSTQVKVEFAAAGSIQSIDVSLAGTTNNTADPNFTTNIPAANLKKNSAGNYQVLFDANSTTGKLLPASIVVEPAEQPVKAVTTSNPVGSFYALVKVNTATSSFTLTSASLRKIPVYSNCTIQTAQPLSK